MSNTGVAGPNPRHRGLNTDEIQDMARPALRRAMRRVPPRNWSWRQWQEELTAEAALSALWAVSEFDPHRGTRLADFVNWRVQSDLYTLHRRARRDGGRQDGPAAALDAAGPDDRAAEKSLDRSLLRVAMARLPQEKRRLLEQIFWEDVPERGLARALGVTHQAVNLRKKGAIRILRVDIVGPDDGCPSPCRALPGRDTPR